jgi:hypothetical protein
MFARPEHNLRFIEQKNTFKCFHFFYFNKVKLLKL